MFPVAVLGFLSLLVAPARASSTAEVAQLSVECEAGRADSCVSLARAQTGVGHPVDLLAARTSYERACTLGSEAGCQGAQGLSSLLGRHVEVFLLSSAARVWVLSGPTWVLPKPAAPVDASAAHADAVQARLPFAEACYAMGLEELPSMEGMLDLSLVVKGGRVSELLAHQSSLQHEETARCVAEELGRIKLPTGSPDGELFLRLRAEPAPSVRLDPPPLGSHLADGLQLSIGDPDPSMDRRVAIALTAAVRQALDGTSCMGQEASAGRWDTLSLTLGARINPAGEVLGLRLVAPPERAALADCLGQQLQGLRVGQTGLAETVGASLKVQVQPTWTAAIVP